MPENALSQSDIILYQITTVVFAEGEFAEDAVIRKFRITAADGRTCDTQHYNLEVVVPTGYRVKSHSCSIRRG